MADSVEITVIEQEPDVIIINVSEQQPISGNVVIGDTDLPASEEIKGMLLYREPEGGGSIFSVCMRKKDGTYGWTDIMEEV